MYQALFSSPSSAPGKLSFGLYGIYTTSCRRYEVVYTVETETELYNRLVPWGIATRVRSNSLSWSLKGDRNGTRGKSSTVSGEMEPALTTASYLNPQTPLNKQQLPTRGRIRQSSVSNDRPKARPRIVWLNSAPLPHRAPPRARACPWSGNETLRDHSGPFTEAAVFVQQRGKIPVVYLHKILAYYLYLLTVYLNVNALKTVPSD